MYDHNDEDGSLLDDDYCDQFEAGIDADAKADMASYEAQKAAEVQLNHLVEQTIIIKQELRSLALEIVRNLGDKKLAENLISQRNKTHYRLVEIERKVSALYENDLESYYLYLLATN